MRQNEMSVRRIAAYALALVLVTAIVAVIGLTMLGLGLVTWNAAAVAINRFGDREVVLCFIFGLIVILLMLEKT
jgi:hypothetical protein